MNVEKVHNTSKKKKSKYVIVALFKRDTGTIKLRAYYVRYVRTTSTAELMSI